jgi:heme/copper-type cytochrome/quinol oxidase subunit 1
MVSVPSAIKVFNWTATLYKGSIRFQTPMLYALGFIGLFTIGGLTDLFLACLALDVHLHDTYFVIAHFHYIMVGGMVMAYLGGLHFWWPKITGRMYPELPAKLAALTVFLDLTSRSSRNLFSVILGCRGGILFMRRNFRFSMFCPRRARQSWLSVTFCH